MDAKHNDIKLTATDKDVAGYDHVHSFYLENAGVRGRFARLGPVMDRILSQHAYPEPISFALAEALLLTAVIGPLVKTEWKLSLQARAENAVKLIATDYLAPEKEGAAAALRAYARFEADALPAKGEKADLFGKGVFGVLIDQGRNEQPYSGMTPLHGGLSASAREYFVQSEQIKTEFRIEIVRDLLKPAGEQWRGAAMMIQKLPEKGGQIVKEFSNEDFERAKVLMETVTVDEMLDGDLSAERLIYRLFHEETPLLQAQNPLEFGCTCSEEKLRQSLSIYSRKDLGHMLTDDGKITGDCQFCGSHYELDPETLTTVDETT